MVSAAFALAAMATGCGGTSGTSGPTMSVSTTSVTVGAGIADPAPTSTIVIKVANLPSTPLYAGYKCSYNGVAAVTDGGSTDATQSIVVSFKSPALLGPGSYEDMLILAVCADAQCKSQIAGSPQTVSIRYTVTTASASLSATSLSPSSAVAGAAGFTLTVAGTGFAPASTVQWNGGPRATTYVSPTQLTAQIAAADVATAGTFPVTVSNAMTGGSSNALTFTVQSPGPSLTRVSPSAVTAGSPAFTLTAIGTSFVASSTVQWNGAALPTTYVSSTELKATVGAAQIASPGTASVTIQNPAASGGTSAAATVTIAAASIDAVSFQITPAHTGFVDFGAVSFPAAPAWTAQVGGSPSYALIAEGKVFITVSVTGGSQLLALDQATGKTLWGPISIAGMANAAYDASGVFVVGDSIGNAALMQRFDAASGALQWSTLLSGQYSFSSGPTAANGFVYTGGAGSGGTVYAVNESNGAITWTKPVANGDSSTPAVTADGVYVTYPCQTYDFDPATGALLWSNSTGCDGGGGGTPVVAANVLYAPNGFGTYNGMTFDAASGSLLGSYVASNPPAFGPGTGYFLQSGTLRGIDLGTSSVRWSFAGDGTLVTSPIVIGSYVVVGGSSGNLYALDGATGNQVWNVKLGAAIPQGAGWGAGMQLAGLAAGDGLLVVPAGNAVTAFALSGGP